MPLALLLLGILFIVASVRGKDKVDELFSTMKSDFTGPNNFFYWGIALFLIGALGYYKPMKPLSNAFLTLVIIVLFFSNRGFFTSFMDQLHGTQTASASDLSPTDRANVNTDLFNIFNKDRAQLKSQGGDILSQYQKLVPTSGVSILTKLFGL